MDDQFSLSSLTRRDFLRLAGLASGALVLPKHLRRLNQLQEEFPAGQLLGRVCDPGPVEVKLRPSVDSKTVATLYEDAVIVRLREVIGGMVPYFRRSLRWIETPEGYIWSPIVQPVRNEPNPDTAAWAESELGEGVWVEVTVPYTPALLINQTPYSHWLQYRAAHGLPYRFYYSQVLWVDAVKQGSDGETYLRVNEKYGNPGDMFWTPASGLRPILPEDVTPIHPDAEEKKVVVDLSSQSLTCFEGSREVYYCRVSTGLNVYGAEREDYLTPVGNFPVWGKYLSTHMAGGTAVAGWDLPGVGWTSIFYQNGQAIHSTFWHNNFGEEMSNGCVNASPEDARWIFRWAPPVVDYNPGQRTVQGYNGTTMINIIEA